MTASPLFFFTHPNFRDINGMGSVGGRSIWVVRVRDELGDEAGSERRRVMNADVDGEDDGKGIIFCGAAPSALVPHFVPLEVPVHVVVRERVGGPFRYGAGVAGRAYSSSEDSRDTHKVGGAFL